MEKCDRCGQEIFEDMCSSGCLNDGFHSPPKTPPKPGISVDNDDLWTMLISTIRYSMGRMTYMPGYCVDLYQSYKSALTVNQIYQIRDEVFRETRDVEDGRLLGMECDHKTWMAFIALLEKDLGL